MNGIRPHHILFTKRTWRSQGDTSALRSNPSLIVPMYDNPHAALHREVFTVPLLDHRTANIVNRDYRPAGNYIASMNRLMSVIDEVGRDPRCGQIERDLGQLAIQAIEIQIPFIKEGQVNGR